MGRPKRWVISESENGNVEIKLSSWKYFPELVSKEMLDLDSFVWRGQRIAAWKLDSTLDRLITKYRFHKRARAISREGHLERFQYAVRGRRGSNPPPITEENEWWALGQHHGLATPLLDWTTSPFVAAYFAFIGTGATQTRHRAVFAIHREVVEEGVEEIMSGPKYIGRESARPEVEFIRPRADENQRLVNQGGLFSRAPDGISLDEWISENMPSYGFILFKILIPNKDRKECLKTLNRMNINHLTLFPDLYGASKYCNLFGEIDRY